MIRILAFLAALFALAPTQAHAQASVVIYCYNGATPNITVPCSTGTPLPVSASVTASITGFPSIQSTGTPISVTTGGVTGTLPTGTVVVATNVGATNGAYCKLGGSATTSDQYIAPNGGWFQFTVGANTQLTCITSTSTTTVNMVGGSGLPTGTGGGGGGSGGAVTCAACATSANQTNATQKTQIVDGSGNVIAATSNALNVDVTNANTNGQATMANSSPVALSSNQSVADPCMFQAKTNVPFSSASGTFAVVTGVSAKKIYVCSLSLIINTPAVAVSLAEGSGTTCGTSNQAAVIGVATNGTAANGMSLAVNGGLTLGNGGGTIAATATAADYLCIFQSGTTQIAGNLTYVQQ